MRAFHARGRWQRAIVAHLAAHGWVSTLSTIAAVVPAVADGERDPTPREFRAANEALRRMQLRGELHPLGCTIIPTLASEE